MDLDEIKQRYKILPMWIRLVCSAVPAACLAGYIYFANVETLTTLLDSGRTEESDARKKFEDARTKKGEIPKLEEQLQFTESELKKAQERLPDTFQIDDVLHKTATLAQENGVTIKLFRPADEKIVGEAFRYKEQTVQMTALGSFPQIARFYDGLLHLEKIVHLRNMTIEDQAFADPVSPTAPMTQPTANARPYVLASADMIIFRSLKGDEPDTPVDPNAPVDPNKPADPNKTKDPAAPAVKKDGTIPPPPPNGGKS